MVEGGDQVAVAGQLLRPGGVLGPHPARPRGEKDDREPLSPAGHRGVDDRAAAGPRDAVDQETGQADPAGEGLGDRPRLALRASQIPGPRDARRALLRRVPELDHDRAPVVRIGGEALGAERVGPLHHPGADREGARRLGEDGHGEGPGGHRAGGDQAGAGQRSRQGQPPAGPPRRSAGTSPQQGREGERRGDGGAGQDRQHLPADPHDAQHDRRRYEDRPRRDGDGPAGGRGEPARHQQRDGAQQDEDFRKGQEQPRDGFGHPAMLGAGPAPPHRARVAADCDRGGNREPRTGGRPATAGGGGSPPVVVPRHIALRRRAHVRRGPAA